MEMHRRRFLQAAGGLAAGPLICWPARAQAQAASGAAAPWIAGLGHGLGIAVHDLSEATLDVCAGAGFGFVRTDLFWSDVETQRHKLDWSRWDPFVAGLKARGLRPLFILGFNNPDVYGGRWMEGVTSYIEMQAFTAFAAAAATRYREADPIWEIWNEPNRANFWEPRENPAEYMALARATADAIRRAQPDAAIIGPGLGHNVGEQVLGLDFLQACLDDGLGGLVDAVSIHPYVDPEVVAPDYDKVQAMVDAAAGGRAVPVMSTEWGFATNKFVSDDLQADVLVRMFLINLSLGIPLSIAYVAVDRTEEYVPKEERTYGIARADHTPKAAYHSLREMNGRLAGVRFREALPVAPGDVALVFEGAGRRWVAAWTAGEPHEAEVAGQTVALTSRPVYLDD
jgi:polysaccharide biosynthesis protein PslG